MANEANFWKQIRLNLGRRLDLQRHEDLAGLGIPDVSYGADGVNGWIELKFLHHFPKRPQTPVRIRHYTPHQKNWLRRRGKSGGRCWLFLRVDKPVKHYLLFDHDGAQEVGAIPKDQLMETARKRWEDKINWTELKKVLIEG